MPREDAPTHKLADVSWVGRLLSPGRVLAGRFRIVDFLGHGAMGEVYRAHDAELDEAVALKTLAARIAGDTAALRRFKREIQLAHKITHPNVCRTFDLYRHREAEGAEIVFLTMELLEGETLAQRLERQGRVEPSEAEAIAGQLGAALDAAHELGIVHRDFKSANVFLVDGAAGPRAVVTDFGLARSLAEDGDAARLTAPDTLVGSPAYMAPEQVRGQAVTPAADIYALGIVLFEMVTGELPFVGETAVSTAMKRLDEAPPSPRSRVPSLDRRWEGVILRCLTVEPEARYERASEVAEALAAAAPVSRRAKGVLWGLLAGLAAIGGAVLLAWLWAGRGDLETAGSAGVRPAVAVLGFRNLSGDPDVAYLGEALSQMLPTELAATGRLRLVPTESAEAARRELGIGDGETLSAESLTRLRDYLAVDLVVTGRYFLTGGDPEDGGGRFEVEAQDVLSGERTATATVEGGAVDFLEVLGALGGELRQRLEAGELTAAQAEAVRASLPSSLESTRLLTQGLQRLQAFDPAAARPLLEEAVAVEPRNPLVHSALAVAWKELGYDDRAAREGEEALALAEGLRLEERRLIEARSYELGGRWDEAVTVYGELWGYFPDNVEYGLSLAAGQVSAGRPQEALATVERLRRLPEPQRADPRIDLAEANAARASSDFARQLEAARRAVEAGRRIGAKRLVAGALRHQAWASFQLGEPQEALVALDEAVRLHREAGDALGAAFALNIQGVLHDVQGNLERSGEAYRSSVAACRAVGNEHCAAAAATNLAILEQRQGDLAAAEEQYLEALRIFRERSSHEAVLATLENLGQVAAMRGDLDRQGEILDETLALYRQMSNPSGIGRILVQRAELAAERGDLTAARGDLEEAMGIFDTTSERSSRAGALRKAGEVELLAGNLERARGAFAEASTIQEELAEKTSRARTLLGVSRLALAEGLADEAYRRAAEASAIYAEAGAGDDEALALALAAEALIAGGDAAAAGERLGRGLELAGATQNARLRLVLALAGARLEIASGAPAVALGELRGALGEARRLGSLPLQLEARLALGEARLAIGDIIEAVAILEELAADAAAVGFELHRRRADDLLAVQGVERSAARRRETAPDRRPGRPAGRGALAGTWGGEGARSAA